MMLSHSHEPGPPPIPVVEEISTSPSTFSGCWAASNCAVSEPSEWPITSALAMLMVSRKRAASLAKSA